MVKVFVDPENLWASRWTKDQIKSMVLEQFEFFWNLDTDTGIVQTQLSQVESARDVLHAVIVSGLRANNLQTAVEYGSTTSSN